MHDFVLHLRFVPFFNGEPAKAGLLFPKKDALELLPFRPDPYLKSEGATCRRTQSTKSTTIQLPRAS